ncbi:Translin [Eremomyces bilateralis CBS 781.70]|uniref:Translin n=1 Tax=Eremomyces bilateralis CBS 781.70 TaxID=1392243 RepID=A0A6G1GH92_9PEZI|nr:Translin [Eremomyces bilateralis CBS 781.70]KAF1817306.1 Translin [Eremomyces bilateralis CBS 781.70]
MSNKRSRDEAGMDSTSDGPFQSMFETFRVELDEHHARRERVIKASRDVTAASKKIIFSLQRTRELDQPISPPIKKTIDPHLDNIKAQYNGICSDLQGLNAYRYQSNISGGHQEFMEALSFQYYLENQALIPYETAVSSLNSLVEGANKITLTVDDYILGIFDMVGELMRFCITAMASTGKLPARSKPRRSTSKNTLQHSDRMDVDDGAGDDVGDNEQEGNVLSDLRQLRVALEALDVPRKSWLENQVRKKMGVMQTCVEKVEKSLYGLVVRGAERPTGWMPDINEAERLENRG